MKVHKRIITPTCMCILCLLFLTSCGMTSASKAKEIALAYVAEHHEEISDSLRIVEERRGDTEEREMGIDRIFRFHLYKDEYPVQNAFMDILVDYKDRDAYDLTHGHNFRIPDTPMIEARLDIDEAIKVFTDDLEDNLYYFTNKSQTAIPMFLIGTTKSVDAEIGELISVPEISFDPRFSYQYLYGDISGIIRDEKLLDEAAMSSIFSVMRDEDNTDAYVSKFQLHTGRRVDYLWKIDLPNERYIFDARTGEMLSFMDFREDQGLDGEYIEEEQALEAAICYLKELETDLSEIRLANIKTPTENAADIFLLRRDYPERYTFEFLRIHNGIGFLENGISVTVSEKNGKILEYTRVWQEDIEFMDSSQLISAEEAFDVYNAFSEFTLGYGLTSNREYRPAYFFLKDIQFAVNAVTGERIYAEE